MTLDEPTEHEINDAIESTTLFASTQTWDSMRDGLMRLNGEDGFYYIVNDTEWGTFEFNLITPSIAQRDTLFTKTPVEFQKWFISKLARCSEPDFKPWKDAREILFIYRNSPTFFRT